MSVVGVGTAVGCAASADTGSAVGAGTVGGTTFCGRNVGDGTGVGVSVVGVGTAVGCAASADTGFAVGEGSFSRSFSPQASSREIEISNPANVYFATTTPSSSKYGIRVIRSTCQTKPNSPHGSISQQRVGSWAP